jgi:DNA (cytosine-5)-methyltransferase 1
MEMLNGLDLFSGIGGLAVALHPWVRVRTYCEVDRYCQAILMSRMAEQTLRDAPIWDDVRSLRGDMCGHIDIVFGGFPCQDISIAGNGVGLDGKRSGLYFELLRLVQEISPRFVFLENVPAIRTRGLRQVVGTLAELGYDCRWTTISAGDVGAPHKRLRWFLLASNTNGSKLRNKHEPRSESETGTGFNGKKEPVANADNKRQDTIRKIQTRKNHESFRTDWWEVEPDVGRVADGVPARVDRLRGLGNAVVPAQARQAFKTLIGLK